MAQQTKDSGFTFSTSFSFNPTNSKDNFDHFVLEKKPEVLKSLPPPPVPQFARYIVKSPAGSNLPHDSNIPITFNQTIDTITTQWTLKEDGSSFSLFTPGLYFFHWGINNGGGSSNFFIAHLVAGQQLTTEQWHTGDFPLVGVQDSHLFSYVYHKTTSSSDVHTFLIRGSTNQRTDPVIGLMGISITFFPFP